jgi:hypothetical protein
MRPRLVAQALGALLLVSGCASTSTMQMGLLPHGQKLVTLVVSEDREVVDRECASVAATGRLLGCHLWRRVTLPGGPDVRLITIVRYTDSLPSALALEIDVHELCHAIASLQPIPDPCHTDNGGAIKAAAHTHPRWHSSRSSIENTDAPDHPSASSTSTR